MPMKSITGLAIETTAVLQAERNLNRSERPFELQAKLTGDKLTFRQRATRRPDSAYSNNRRRVGGQRQANTLLANRVVRLIASDNCIRRRAAQQVLGASLKYGTPLTDRRIREASARAGTKEAALKPLQDRLAPYIMKHPAPIERDAASSNAGSDDRSSTFHTGTEGASSTASSADWKSPVSSFGPDSTDSSNASFESACTVDSAASSGSPLHAAAPRPSEIAPAETTASIVRNSGLDVYDRKPAPFRHVYVHRPLASPAPEPERRPGNDSARGQAMERGWSRTFTNSAYATDDADFSRELSRTLRPVVVRLVADSQPEATDADIQTLLEGYIRNRFLPTLTMRVADLIDAEGLATPLEKSVYSADGRSSTSGDRIPVLTRHDIQTLARQVAGDIASNGIARSRADPSTGVDWVSLCDGLESPDRQYKSPRSFFLGDKTTPSVLGKLLQKVFGFDSNNVRNALVAPLVPTAAANEGLLAEGVARRPDDPLSKISEFSPFAAGLGTLISLADLAVDIDSLFDLVKLRGAAGNRIDKAVNDRALIKSLESRAPGLEKLVASGELNELSRRLLDDDVYASLSSTDPGKRRAAFDVLCAAAREAHDLLAGNVADMALGNRTLKGTGFGLTTAGAGVGRAITAAPANALTALGGFSVGNAASVASVAAAPLGAISGTLQMVYRGAKLRTAIGKLIQQRQLRKEAARLADRETRQTGPSTSADGAPQHGAVQAVLQQIARKQATGALKWNMSAQSEMLVFGGTTLGSSTAIAAAGGISVATVAVGSGGIGLAGIAGVTGIALGVKAVDDSWKNNNATADALYDSRQYPGAMSDPNDGISSFRQQALNEVENRNEARRELLSRHPVAAARFLVQQLRLPQSDPLVPERNHFSTVRKHAIDTVSSLLDKVNLKALKLTDEMRRELGDSQNDTEAVIHLLQNAPQPKAVELIQELFNLK